MIFAEHDYVVEKGEPATCAYFIVQGKVRVESPALTGARALYLKPPSWIGDPTWTELFRSVVP